ncbi:MAG: tetratricopeptide repeat protein [Candidatus Omnitrophota bacterium]
MNDEISSQNGAAPEASPSEPTPAERNGTGQRVQQKRVIDKLRQSSARRDVLKKTRMSLGEDNCAARAQEFQDALMEGDANKIENERLEIKRTLDLERKTKRMSAAAMKCAKVFLELSAHLVEQKRAVEEKQQSLSVYQSEEKRKNLNSAERIEVHNLVTQLRTLLPNYFALRDKTSGIFQTLCRMRSKEQTEESSLMRSAENYLQYVEGPQRGHLEVQIKEKMKDMPYEHRVASLKSFIENLTRLAPSIIQAEVERLLELAEEFYIEEHYDDAVAELNKAMEYRPAQEEIYSLLAKCWAQKGERERELENLAKAVECNPQNFRLVMALAEALEEDGRDLEAIPIYQKALDMQPEQFSLTAHLARLAFDRQLWKTAIPLLLKIINKKTDSLKTLRRLGIALIRTGEYDRGVSILKSVLQRGERDGQIDLNLGLAYRAKGFYSDAHRHFQAASAALPEDCESAYWLAVSHFDRGDFHETETIIRSIILRCYDPPRTSLLLSKALRRLGKTEEAAAILRTFIDHGNKEREILLEYGQVCLQAGKADEAYEKLQTLVNLHPSDEEVRLAFGLACVQSKRFQEAIRYIGPMAG